MAKIIFPSESEIQARIQLEGPIHGCILMRNNSGAMLDADGRMIRFGLGNVSKQHSEKMKSSDLIGITRVLITPEMVGRTVAVFTAIEVKSPSWKPSSNLREKAQENFLSWVTMNGGIAGMINSVDAFKRLLKR